MPVHTHTKYFIVIRLGCCEDQDKSVSDMVGIIQLCAHAYVYINLVVLVYFSLVSRSRLHVSSSTFLEKINRCLRQKLSS